MIVVLVLWTKPSDLYRHRRGLGLHKVGYRERNLHIQISKLAFHARRVPSGHGTKSSILYLHSPTVRPKYIVRLSEDPLVQDSLSSPRTRLQWRWVRRTDCLRHCKAGSSSEYFKTAFKHRKCVWLCKRVPHTYTESIVFYESNPLTNFVAWHHVIARSLFQTVF